MKIYSALLLTASISLAGCQTTTTTPSKDLPQHKNIRTMQADSDLDGDGVLDAIDECPQTSINLVADERGCPVTVTSGVGHFYGGIIPFSMNSSQPNATALGNLKGFANIDDKCVIMLSGHISKYEDTERNKTLARNRVEFVKNYIVMNYQVNPKQIETDHYGSERSKAPSESYEDSTIDQRVDVEMQYQDGCSKPTNLDTI